jgi:hypothetical protein
MSYFEARPTAVGAATARCNSVQGVTATLAFTAIRICNLQNVKRPGGFEPDPHWVAKTGPASRCTDEPGSKITDDHAGLLDGAWSSSTR